jgi:hypothetical protein
VENKRITKEKVRIMSEEGEIERSGYEKGERLDGYMFKMTH